MTTVVINVLLAYLLGSICGSLVLGRLRGVDIRTSGSGNPGGTNALRTQGFRFALAVVIIDMGKGALAAGWLPVLELAGPASISGPAQASLCALAAVLGHIFPIFFRFRGGKGAGTWAGALTVLSWPVAGGVFAVWTLVIVLTGYVGLGTMLAAAASLPLAIWLAGALPGSPLFAFCVAAPLVILAAHQSNIRNLFRGTENRFERVRVQNWRRPPTDE